MNTTTATIPWPFSHEELSEPVSETIKRLIPYYHHWPFSRAFQVSWNKKWSNTDEYSPFTSTANHSIFLFHLPMPHIFLKHLVPSSFRSACRIITINLIIHAHFTHSLSSFHNNSSQTSVRFLTANSLQTNSTVIPTCHLLLAQENKHYAHICAPLPDPLHSKVKKSAISLRLRTVCQKPRSNLRLCFLVSNCDLWHHNWCMGTGNCLYASLICF